MSIIARNIVCDGPDVMSKVIEIGILPISSSAEGSPIYTTINATVTVAGSYTDGDLTYDYNDTVDLTEQTRTELRSIVGGVDIAGENYEIVRVDGDSSWVDFGVITVVPADTFLAVQSQKLGCNGGSPPFAPPEFLATNTQAFIDGTRTDDSVAPPVITTPSMELLFTTPYFVGSIKDGDLVFRTTLSVTVNDGDVDQYSESFNHDISATSWATTDFRDVRGTYGETSFDVNGISYTWSVTIG
jgi:hypothetical protein